MTLYVATSNPGKLRDFAAANTHHIPIEPLPNLGRIAPPPEDEPTFADNARIKAIYYSRFAADAIVVADDSGLEVDALSGAPGVRSARYADDAGFEIASNLPLDERNNLCLLQALNNIQQPNRTARYRCVLAAARNGEVIAEGDGTVEGLILTMPRGTEGFGYDPLFYLLPLDKTMAELDASTKLALSHRGRAFRALVDDLNKLGLNRSQIRSLK